MCLAQGHNTVMTVRLEPATGPSISGQALYHLAPNEAWRWLYNDNARFTRQILIVGVALGIL